MSFNTTHLKTTIQRDNGTLGQGTNRRVELRFTDKSYVGSLGQGTDTHVEALFT